MDSLNQIEFPIIVGKVEEGKQLGRKIGFPTANLELVPGFKLENGVYGVYVYHNSKRYYGMLNVGYRPTFKDGKQKTYEVHILDFNEFIYGEYLTIEISLYIREEQKFNQLQDLVSQLQADELFARKNLM
ncbi:riboflavin kinase [Ureibacillus sinduriensis]|uniref:riboflavin kinase n=1 Tax=Ureibacillus sinduriensis TaxID=561440 RepID=UPI00068C5BB1|nr:riboflavin kinase [Ureibacillus sinduriensis]